MCESVFGFVIYVSLPNQIKLLLFDIFFFEGYLPYINVLQDPHLTFGSNSQKSSFHHYTGTYLHNSEIGIYGGHAYSITGLYENADKHIPKLVKVRNPWVIK